MSRVAVSFSILSIFLLLAPVSAVALVEEGGDIGVWFVGSGLDADAYQPSSAVNDVDGHFLLLWTQDEDDLGFRVYGGLVDAATLGGIVSPFAMDGGTGNARECSAAFDPLRRRYLVVWSQDADAPGAFEIHGRLFASDLTPVAPAFRISSSGSVATDPTFDAHRPRAAADGVGNFLVVWSADDDTDGFGDGVFDLYARRVSSTGAFSAPADTRVTDVTSAGSLLANDALDPEVVYNPVLQEYVVAYEADFDNGLFYDPSIYLLTVPGSGGIVAKGTPVPLRVSGPAGTSKDGTFYAKNPSIAYDTRQEQMLIVWDWRQVDQPGVAGRMVAAADYTLGPTVLSFSEEGAGGNEMCIARDPHVTYNLYADRFLVAWSGSAAPSPVCPVDRQILVREVDRDGTVVGSGPLPISDAGGVAFSATSPHLLSNPLSERVLAQWSGDPTTSGEFDVFGQFLLLDQATAVDDGTPNGLPTVLQLSAAPNPFNPNTTLHFALPKSGPTRIALYDVRGQLVKVLVDEPLPAGHHQRKWDGRDHRGRTVASGVYFTRLENGGDVRRARLVLLK